MLFTKKSYERIRAKLPNDKVYVYDLLEDSVDAGVCGNCLCCECDWMTSTPPVETLLFQEASRSFLEDGMCDMVSTTKTSNPPLSVPKNCFCKLKDKSKIAGRMMMMQRMTMKAKPTTLRKKTTDYTGSEWKRCLSFIL